MAVHADELEVIGSVTAGRRTRARWLTEHGWVRIERTSDTTVVASGPPCALRRIWLACHPHWRGVAGHDDAPAPYIGHRGQAELMLVHAAAG